MKIAILIPSYGDTRARFTQALAQMIAHTMRGNIVWNNQRVIPEIEVLMSQATLAMARNGLLREAIQWGADFILWLDNDHVFPRDALFRLLGAEKSVIGINQARRGFPAYPTAPTTIGLDGQLLYTTEEKAASDLVEEVGSMGLGICLMTAESIVALSNARPQMWPVFKETLGAESGKIGEDVELCARLKEAGVPIYVHHGISWATSHLTLVPLTNADTIDQREAWEAKVALGSPPTP